ncbi:MAG TPA: nucleotidyltransferase domain-containing protein [Armatimonadota bacterium]|nr:nucleotidyltransferase domain-containing protein [Armatimonadota bacterium]
MRDFGSEDINSIISRLAENPEVLCLMIFGSRSRGTYWPKSDVDLLVVLGERDASLEVLHPVLPGSAVRFDVWLRSAREMRELLDTLADSPFVLEAIERGKILKDTDSLLQNIQTKLVGQGRKPNFNQNMARFRLTHGLEALEYLAEENPLCFHLLYHLEVAACIGELISAKGITQGSIREVLPILEEEEPEFFALIENACQMETPSSRIEALRKLLQEALCAFGGPVHGTEFIATGTGTISPQEQNELGIALWSKLTGGCCP